MIEKGCDGGRDCRCVDEQGMPIWHGTHRGTFHEGWVPVVFYPKHRPIEEAMKDMVQVKEERHFPTAVRTLYCFRCGWLFKSGSLHCPNCFDYDSLIEPDEAMLRDLEILLGREAQR